MATVVIIPTGEQRWTVAIVGEHGTIHQYVDLDGTEMNEVYDAACEMAEQINR